jgi:hypothetical protein
MLKIQISVIAALLFFYLDRCAKLSAVGRAAKYFARNSKYPMNGHDRAEGESIMSRAAN